MEGTNCIILAAGKGTRMQTKQPKVLCEVATKPMVLWVQDHCFKAGFAPQDLCYVLGFEAEQVEQVVDERANICYQTKQLGTGHAVQQAIPFLEENKGQHTLVLAGDAPFIDEESILGSFEKHVATGASATVITATLEDSSGYGRIKKENGYLVGIVEQKDASEKERAITEVNSGAYWFCTADLLGALGQLKNDNTQHEYYLTDAIGILLGAGKECHTYMSESHEVVLGANDRKSLYALSEIAKEKMIATHMAKGVSFLDTHSVVLSPDITIGRDTVVLPGTMLTGNTSIGEGCTIGPNSVVHSSVVGDGSVINASQVYDSHIGEGVKVGPFSHIRPDSILENGVKVGDFVEVKNSRIGAGTSLAHLTYIGDSDFGQHVNVGCGVVTVNYDGEEKSRTVVEDFSFIGCNANLISPVRVGEQAYIGAGSTITKDVPSKALAVARSGQVHIEGWAEKKLRAYRTKKEK